MLYLDTSALLKRYIHEPGSEAVQACVVDRQRTLALHAGLRAPQLVKT